jgi:hypothetical protein
MSDKNKFPSEIIDLPSKGLVYSKDSPLINGKLELKYMTTREEDILTSQNLIKKGVVIEKLLDSLILTEGVNSDDLIVGDKNAIMVAARILAYGPEYTVEVTSPLTGRQSTRTFNLADCPFKELPDDVDYSSGIFQIELPISKVKVDFKLLTGKDEKIIEKELNSIRKLGVASREVSTRLKHAIISIDGDDSVKEINSFVDNMLSKDSLALREEMARVAPDIDMEQEIEDEEGGTVSLVIPMTVDFFWPKTAG